MDRGVWQAIVHGVTESDMTEVTQHARPQYVLKSTLEIYSPRIETCLLKHPSSNLQASLSSAGKESICNAGDPSSIPVLGRFARKGTGYPLQYSWISLVAQLVNNPPAMQETRVRSLGWENPVEKGKATPSSILAWRIP